MGEHSMVPYGYSHIQREYSELGMRNFFRHIAEKTFACELQGLRFDPSELNPAFAPYFDTGQRIKVRFWQDDDLTYTGTVGITTGWRPAFLLMRRSSDHGSSWLLTQGVELLAVQINGKYVEVTNVV